MLCGMNFALIGAAGFVAPRHLKAIADVGGNVVMALDPHDAVGVLDQHHPGCLYFSEPELFQKALEDRNDIGRVSDRVDWLVVCSPNYLHAAHVRMGLRNGCDVICEKPVGICSEDLDSIVRYETKYGRKTRVILQLRHHPALIRIKEAMDNRPGDNHDVQVEYVTPRGSWYHGSWKGDKSKSGGLAMNIGVHLFDMLCWFFGPPHIVATDMLLPAKAQGSLSWPGKRASWFLSTDPLDLPKAHPLVGRQSVHRRIVIDGEGIEFSDNFGNLHTTAYQEILEGRGFGVEDARAGIEVVSQIRG